MCICVCLETLTWPVLVIWSLVFFFCTHCNCRLHFTTLRRIAETLSCVCRAKRARICKAAFQGKGYLRQLLTLSYKDRQWSVSLVQRVKSACESKGMSSGCLQLAFEDKPEREVWFTYRRVDREQLKSYICIYVCVCICVYMHIFLIKKGLKGSNCLLSPWWQCYLEVFISYLSTLVIINKTVIFFKFNCQLQFCLTTLGQYTVLVSKQYIIAALTQTFPFNLVVILLSPTIPTFVTIQSILPAPSSFSAHILYCQFFFNDPWTIFTTSTSCGFVFPPASISFYWTPSTSPLYTRLRGANECNTFACTPHLCLTVLAHPRYLLCHFLHCHMSH